MTIQELREKRSEIWDEAKKFLDSRRNDSGLLSEDDAKTYDDMESKIVAYNKEIERLERHEKLNAELGKPTSEPILSNPNDKKGRASDEYKNAMLGAFRTNFRQVSNILQEGVDGDGGYLVPVEYDKRIIDKLHEENIMRKLGTTIKTNGEHKINIAAAKTAAVWIEEGKPITFGDAAFEQIFLDAHKVGAAIKVTEELLYDSAFPLEDYITKMFGQAISDSEEDAFFNGNGTTQPTGLFHATKGGQIAGTLTTALKSDDMLDLVYTLKRPYRKNAAFIMNDRTLLGLRKLKDNNGAYIWQPPYQAGEPDRVLGYPVYTSAFVPENAIAFGDYKYYNIGDRGSRSFKPLNELFAGEGMIGFMMKERVDGILVLPEAVQIMKLASSAKS